MKDFKQNERVKRFPRECDHIFHIKCLEVWMKIEASCPNCERVYLGYEYKNKYIKHRSVGGIVYNDSEHFSIFNEWKKQELVNHISRNNDSNCKG